MKLKRPLTNFQKKKLIKKASKSTLNSEYDLDQILLLAYEMEERRGKYRR